MQVREVEREIVRERLNTREGESLRDFSRENKNRARGTDLGNQGNLGIKEDKRIWVKAHFTHF